MLRWMATSVQHLCREYKRHCERNYSGFGRISDMALLSGVLRPLKQLPIELSIIAGATLSWWLLATVLRSVGFSDAGSPAGYESISVAAILKLLMFGSLPLLLLGVNWLRRNRAVNRIFEAYYQLSRLTLYAYGSLLFYTTLTFVTMVAFLSVNVQYTAAWSLAYLRMDQWFGVYGLVDELVGVSLAVPVLETFVFWMYTTTFAVVCFAIFGIALSSAQLAREYSIAFLFTILLSAPFWVLFPAIAPHQLSVTDSFVGSDWAEEIARETEMVSGLHAKYSGTPWAEHTAAWSHFWEGLDERGMGLPISCNPSMHIMWVVILVIFLFRINRILGCFGAAYLASVAFATVFFLQHYVVDVLTGFLGAVVVLWFVNYALRFERGHMDVEFPTWFAPLLWLQRLGGRISR